MTKERKSITTLLSPELPGCDKYYKLLASLEETSGEIRARSEAAQQKQAPLPERHCWIIFQRNPHSSSPPPPPEKNFEEQLNFLERKFKKTLFQDYSLTLCHLAANSGKTQEILQEYLNSPEFSHDSELFGQFVSFCLSKFNPHPYVAIKIIQEADFLSLDRDQQRIQTRVFRKLFKKINPPTRKSVSLSEVGQQIAQQLMQDNHQPPQSVLNEYQKYVREKVLSKLGLNSTPASENLDKEEKRQKSPPSPPNSQIPQESRREEQFHYQICYLASINTDPVLVRDCEEFQRFFRRRRLSLTAEEIFARIQKLDGRHPVQIYQQYGTTVAGGPFAGWHEILLGKTGRILFKIETLSDGKRQITFCAGSHEVVYGTKRRKPRDRARSL